MSEDNQTVSYTVKELLGQIHDKLDKLALNLDAKASQESLDHLAERVDQIEQDVTSLKASRSQLLAISGIVGFCIPLLVTLVLFGVDHL